MNLGIVSQADWNKVDPPATVDSYRPRPPIHVGGTPGTGKTAFGLYILYRLLALEEYQTSAFIYRHGDVNPGCFLRYNNKDYYHPSIVRLFSDGLLLKLLTRNFTNPIWTILDGAAAIPTGTPPAYMIVLTSPGQQTISLKHLLKHATTIVNPPWTLLEIEKVRALVFSWLMKGHVEEEFRKWGGIPRILFDYSRKPEKLSELRDGIYASDPIILFEQAGLSRIDHTNVSGLHFHLVPGQKVPTTVTDAAIRKLKDHRFRYPAYCWATTWLQDQFWEVLKNERGEQSILDFLNNRNYVSTARAYAFEPHVFRTLENGGLSGRLRRLTDEGHEELPRIRLDALNRFTFVNVDEVSAESIRSGEMFYVPVQTNHVSVDFYVPHLGMLIQITVGKKHGVKSSGLEKILKDKLFNAWRNDHPDQKLRLVFLCDRFNFDQFTKQPYLTTRGITLKSPAKLTQLNDSFEQYAWELDVSHQIAAHVNHRPMPHAPTRWDELETPTTREKKKSRKRKRDVE